MLIFVALLYFSLACTLSWLIFFPSGRALLIDLVERIGAAIERRVDTWQRARAFAAESAARASPTTPLRPLKFARRHALALGAGACALLLPALAALMLGEHRTLEPYDGASLPPDPQVAALLRGEQLAPPQALPPLVFRAVEVVQLRPLLVDASRNWDLLNIEFSQRLLLTFKIMKERHGYEMALLEGYRSPMRQDELAKLGSGVTNARAFQSYHQFGLAADCAFWRDGRLIISEKDPWALQGYRLYGEVAESLGLTWGGRWTMMDFGHTELRQRALLGKTPG